MNDDYYTITELAGVLGCSYANVVALTHRGLLLYHGNHHYPKAWNAERIRRLKEIRKHYRRKWLRAF